MTKIHGIYWRALAVACCMTKLARHLVLLGLALWLTACASTTNTAALNANPLTGDAQCYGGGTPFKSNATATSEQTTALQNIYNISFAEKLNQIQKRET